MLPEWANERISGQEISKAWPPYSPFHLKMKPFSVCSEETEDFNGRSARRRGGGGFRSGRSERFRERWVNRVAPVFPNSSDAERRAVPHRDGIGLLHLGALYGHPLEEAVHRYDALA